MQGRVYVRITIRSLETRYSLKNHKRAPRNELHLLSFLVMLIPESLASQFSLGSFELDSRYVSESLVPTTLDKDEPPEGETR